LVPRSPPNSVQIPAKANSGRLSLRANHTTSFFLVSGFRSGAYSEKLQTVLDFLHQGDVLMVTRIDRLAGSIGDLQASFAR
jgi:DNA invertase Pin-like site-specific DNA recombinase